MAWGFIHCEYRVKSGYVIYSFMSCIEYEKRNYWNR